MRDANALYQNVLLDLSAVESGTSPEWAVYAAQNLTRTLLKKWRPEHSSDRATSSAALSFLEANHLAKNWTWNPRTDADIFLMEGVRRQLAKFFYRRRSDQQDSDMLFSSYLTILEAGRTGPGSGLRADGESFYAKLGSSKHLTTTSCALYLMYRAYCDTNPTWEEGESLRVSQTGSSCTIVDCSRMTFVPKNVDTDRAICVEPVLNMFFQLGLESVLRDRMGELWNLQLQVQPEVNRVLARIGSRDGSFATLDLSSASDLISLELCRLLLPQYVYDTLLELRVPKTDLADFGLRVELGMMSTMGNGFTFPMMTILLSCIVRACYAELGIPIRDNPRVGDVGVVPGNWGVFGDDIIVVQEAHDRVVDALHLFGLRVNTSKSFNTGPFRESCGHDYYCGHDVRGVYLKRIASRRDVAIAVNLLNDWSFRTGIPLRASVRYLMEGESIPFVPYADGFDAGIRVPSSVFRPRVKRFKAVYDYLAPQARRYRIGDTGIVPPKGGRRWFYNGPMLLLSLLKGELRDGQISVRQNGSLYQTRRRVTPWWDYMPPSLWVNPHDDWLRWKAAVEYNVLDLEA